MDAPVQGRQPHLLTPSRHLAAPGAEGAGGFWAGFLSILETLPVELIPLEHKGLEKMTDIWTAQDDAILEARATAREAREMVPWPVEAHERPSDGTTIELHDPGVHADDVLWGFCAEISATPGDPEAVMRASIGDRVRPGHEEALDQVIAEINREMAETGHPVQMNVPPFSYVRDGDEVFLEARFCPDELTDDDRFWLPRQFDITLVNYVPDADFGPHMEGVHFEGTRLTAPAMPAVISSRLTRDSQEWYARQRARSTPRDSDVDLDFEDYDHAASWSRSIRPDHRGGVTNSYPAARMLSMISGRASASRVEPS